MKEIRSGELSNMLPLCFQKIWKDPKIPAAGRIAGTYRSSFYMEFPRSDSREEEPLLVYVGPSSRPLCAFGIALAEEMVQELLENCREGSMVRLKEENLVIYGQEIYVLRLFGEHGFIKKDLRIPFLNIRNSRMHGLLKKEIEGADWKDHMGLSWENKFLSCACAMAVGKKGLEMEEWIGFFCGRGQGLTPAGDDILLGYVALFLAARRPEGRVFASYLTGYGAGRTTNVSLAYYKALAAGFVNEDFKQFLLCLAETCQGGEEGLIKQIKRLGHTSGHDTLFGAFLALECFEHDEEG